MLKVEINNNIINLVIKSTSSGLIDHSKHVINLRLRFKKIFFNWFNLIKNLGSSIIW
jgi:hypothetical protein